MNRSRHHCSMWRLLLFVAAAGCCCRSRLFRLSFTLHACDEHDQRHEEEHSHTKNNTDERTDGRVRTGALLPIHSFRLNARDPVRSPIGVFRRARSCAHQRAALARTHTRTHRHAFTHVHTHTHTRARAHTRQSGEYNSRRYVVSMCIVVGSSSCFVCCIEGAICLPMHVLCLSFSELWILHTRAEQR